VVRRFLSFFSRSLRGRLSLLIAAALLPAAVLVSWLILQSYRNERRALERHLIGAAHATSLLIDATLVERQSLLQGLSTSGRLQQDDLDGFRDQASSVIRGENEWIVVIDSDGHQRMNTKFPAGTSLPKIAFIDEFRDAMHRGQPYVSNLTLGPATKHYMLFTAIPIKRGGELKYTLNMAMYPEMFHEALAQGGAAREWTASIIDRAGYLATRNRNHVEFVGVKAGAVIADAIARSPNGLVESVTLDGVESITAYARSPRWGWTVVIAAPRSELFASAEQLLKIALAVALFFGSAASLAAWWVGRGVVSAVQTLVEKTEALGRGQSLPDGDTGIEETDFVFRALTDTSQKLVSREGELMRANRSLTTSAEALRQKQERLDAARTAAATGTFVWHIRAGTFESDEGLNTLVAVNEGENVGSLDAFLARVHLEDRSRVRLAMESCATSGTDIVCEYRVQRTEGIRWLATKGKIAHGASGPYMAAGCVDITERKQAESEIARSRDVALAAARAKDEFIAALSHELRTPLNPVLLVASDAAQQLEYPLEAREAFALIAKNAALEARLIDDLLDVTRITQGKLSLEMRLLDLHTVLREAITTVRGELDEKGQRLELNLCAASPPVQGDPTRLQQVFWNILKNAVKFTPAYGRIVVTSRATADAVEVEISDSGIGLTAAEMARSFKTFSQGDHALNENAHRFGGLGLGLAISRVLVEHHAGKISVQSAGRGQGATFTVRLPLIKQPTDTNGPNASAAIQITTQTNGHGVRLLLVEDHEATRVTLDRLLTRRGYLVKSAACSVDALKVAAENTFDLVMSDIGLPDSDGYTLMKQLRDRYRLRGVALTGYGMEDDIERGRAAGFVAHLTKPVDVHKLAAVLKQMHPPPPNSRSS
jgi:signal transduction histidine kinase/ActR/RegA family two-component response regulator